MGRKLLAVLTSLGLMTAAVLPVSAGYTGSEEIAFSLRPMETEGYGYEANGNVAYVPVEEAQAGTTVHIGMYIEAEYADLVFLYAKMQSDSPNVTFNEETFYNPTHYYSDEKLTYTLSDGTVIASRLKPYCFGYVNSSNVYVSTSPSLSTNFNAEDNSFYLNWMYGITSGAKQDTASFLGSSSDELSFVEFDVELAAGTEPGVYRISFVDGVNENGTPLTAVESDDSAEGLGYTTTIPTMKGATIVVGKRGDTNLDDVVDSTDASAILVYAAERGSGSTAYLTSEELREKERLVCYLSDVDGAHEVIGESDGSGLNSVDASSVLVYVAIKGSGGTPDWNAIIG